MHQGGEERRVGNVRGHATVPSERGMWREAHQRCASAEPLVVLECCYGSEWEQWFKGLTGCVIASQIGNRW